MKRWNVRAIIGLFSAGRKPARGTFISIQVFRPAEFWPANRVRCLPAMAIRCIDLKRALWAPVFVGGCALVLPHAGASTCKTESQLGAPERDALSDATRAMVRDVQNGNIQSLQSNTIPAVASDFGGI